MDCQIEHIKNPSSADIQVLYDGIMTQAKQKKGMKSIDIHGYFIKDENGKIIGGCCCCVLYGSLFIDSLWVAEELRGKKYGTELMESAEKLAKENECNFIAVNTMDWEALDFYKKLGFQVEFQRHGFDKDSVFYYLRKNLK